MSISVVQQSLERGKVSWFVNSMLEQKQKQARYRPVESDLSHRQK